MNNNKLPGNEAWLERCMNDGEFLLAARHWNGGIRLEIGAQVREFFLEAGKPTGSNTHPDGVIAFSGTDEVWSQILSAMPTRFHNDLMANIAQGQGLARNAEAVVFAQYYPAVMRAIEIMREMYAGDATDKRVMPHDTKPPGTFDAPTGRYVHLSLNGVDHRIYFEEAGTGIPVLLQHTAGCHGSQWRHLFEIPEITRRFRLIAYDLPYHGKSIPPVSNEWWSTQYFLRGDFLRSIPVAFSEALALDRPVFMGCSVGGLLALDLAHKHPDRFRAVISVEGALKIEGQMSSLGELYHPQVNNEYKARLMDGLMSPSSPKPYRKETSYVYASGWPPVFLGDLYYYIEDYDLREHADEIDTRKVGVHILSGEYDYSGTSELGRAAHEAIRGSTWSEMKGVGHFPMSENPAAFVEYLQPVLDTISA